MTNENENNNNDENMNLDGDTNPVDPVMGSKPLNGGSVSQNGGGSQNTNGGNGHGVPPNNSGYVGAARQLNFGHFEKP